MAIIQARMGSSRLPGKVLLPIEGEPMLDHVMHRVGLSRHLHQIVVATTSDARDDILVERCREKGWACYRGSEDDVLDRYYQAALAFSAEVIVRITSDCPLIDPGIIDRVIDAQREKVPSGYASNTLPPRTFPRGLDVEAFSMEALARAWELDTRPGSREHVTPYLYQHPELFQLHVVTHTENLSGWRWTVDTEEDLELVRRIYSHLKTSHFTWREVLELLSRHPDWRKINAHIEQKKVIV